MRGMFLTNLVTHLVNPKTTPTVSGPRAMNEYVKASNIGFGTLLLHMEVDYHHVVNECEEAWAA